MVLGPINFETRELVKDIYSVFYIRQSVFRILYSVFCIPCFKESFFRIGDLIKQSKKDARKNRIDLFKEVWDGALLFWKMADTRESSPRC